MCGISGLFHYGEGQPPLPSRELIEGMVSAIAHRGPDGRGVFLEPGVGLGHCRLAVLDPSPAGAQPMASASRATVITYNGELYNFKALRDMLEELGVAFFTESDTEVILAAYEAWGEEAFVRFNGIFAFALWDKVRRRLYLVRDRFGVKPLFYGDDGRVVRFGSEIKAILADGAVSRRVDWQGLHSFLTFGYVHAPLTGFAGIRQLLPGSYLLADGQGVRCERFWTPDPHQERISVSFQEAQEAFSAHFEEAVRRQMISDVPLGAFLSGGLDSTAIVEVMGRCSDHPVRTFTMGFRESGFDESAIARETAARLGSKHHEETISLDLAETLQKTIHHCEDPFADSSLLALYPLCRMARQEVKVVLSGDGADELMGGYPTYDASRLASYARWLLPGILRRGILSPLARSLPVVEDPYALRQVATRFLAGLEEGGLRAHGTWRRHFSPADLGRLIKPGHHGAMVQHDPLAAFVGSAGEPSSGDWLRPLLDMDFFFYLPSDMLVKVDRMSMAHGLEARVPFLDNGLVDFLHRLPGEHLHRFRKEGKRPLRAHLSRRLPWFDLSRRKHGFNVPIGRGFKGPLHGLLMDVLATPPFSDHGPFRKEPLMALAERHRRGESDTPYELFTALTLGLWWNLFSVTA